MFSTFLKVEIRIVFKIKSGGSAKWPALEGFGTHIVPHNMFYSWFHLWKLFYLGLLNIKTSTNIKSTAITKSIRFFHINCKDR